MKKIFLIVAGLIFNLSIQAQKFTAEKSYIKFYSHATIEDITAQTTKVSSIFEANGNVVFVVPISEFEFDNSLMKTHFNEKYMESDKFPKATFEGKITGYQPSAQGEQKVTAVGKLTIHGVTQEVQIAGTIQNTSAATVTMKSKFIVKLEDYKIDRPQLLWQKLAEQIEVTVEFGYKSL